MMIDDNVTKINCDKKVSKKDPPSHHPHK